jgi:hypothetical protein
MTMSKLLQGLLARLSGRSATAPQRPKIFVIGPSKCATTALHRFLGDQGIDSAHCRDGRAFVGIEIESRVGRAGALRDYLDRHEAYSDMVYGRTGHPINAARHFRLFHALYPDAFFIFNDREEDDLIRSMSRHRGSEKLASRCELLGLPADAVLDDARAAYHAHKADVLGYFAGSDRFLHFRVDQDPIEDLIRFLSPAYTLFPAHWTRHNATSDSVGKPVSRLKQIRRRLHVWVRWAAVPFNEIEASVYAQALLLIPLLGEAIELLG